MRFSITSALTLLVTATAQKVRMGASCDPSGAFNCDPDNGKNIMVCQDSAWTLAGACKEGYCGWPEGYKAPHCLV